jgi:hypothetical protein
MFFFLGGNWKVKIGRGGDTYVFFLGGNWKVKIGRGGDTYVFFSSVETGK